MHEGEWAMAHSPLVHNRPLPGSLVNQGVGEKIGEGPVQELGSYPRRIAKSFFANRA